MANDRMFEIPSKCASNKVKYINFANVQCSITGESKFDINLPISGAIPTVRQILQVKIITPAFQKSVLCTIDFVAV